jgi:hypothetical protein
MGEGPTALISFAKDAHRTSRLSEPEAHGFGPRVLVYRAQPGGAPP